MKSSEKKKINWRHALQNNIYILRLLAKACPWVVPLSLFHAVLGALHSFMANTYLFKYALNALEEGQPLDRILLTLGIMLTFTVVYIIFRTLVSSYMDLAYIKADCYFQALFQEKAAQLDLACYENADFYDTYVKAADEGTNRAYAVMDALFETVWVTVTVSATATLIFTIDPVFILIVPPHQYILQF